MCSMAVAAGSQPRGRNKASLQPRLQGKPPMSLPSRPETTIFQDLASFQQFAEEVQGRITDPAKKKQLGDMLKQLKDARARAEEVVPGVVKEIKREAESLQVEAAAATKELERLQAELEAKNAEA